jgi:hypothetical protein
MIHRLGFVLGLGAVILLVGCAREESPLPPDVIPEVEKGADGVSYCLDPNDPAVHYQSDNASECAGLVLRCAEGQFGFDNSCGCGCIDKGELSCPAVEGAHIRWVSRDSADCGDLAPTCELGELAFSNSCGCGCIQH